MYAQNTYSVCAGYTFIVYIRHRHRAFSGEVCQFLFSTLVVLYTCLRLLSIGPWGPWVLVTCSGSVLALRLVMEIVVLGTPHPRSQFSRCYPLPLKSAKKQHCKKDTQKYTKLLKRLSK